MVRILIADDHSVVRSGLTLILTAQADFEVIGEASTGAETVEKAIALQPDILLLDVGMPDLNGLEAARIIRSKAPAIAIVVLTMYDDEAYLRQFLELGAAGYVLKKAADTELVDAIRAVSRGETFIYPSLTRQLVDFYLHRLSPTRPDEPEIEISPRETEVLRLVAFGYTGQQIADQLCISASTVETHRAHIMEKLGLRGRAQLVRYAISKGLLD
jgi:two-component system, NarL family, response regulator NreC